MLVHRLLKNRVGEELGVPAYALYTDTLTGAMGLEDPTTAGMRAYRETLESVGEIEGWVTDLGGAWQAEQQRVRTKVTDEDALAVVTVPAAVPREILWEWTTSPARRTRWSLEPMQVVEDLAGGRRGIGTVNHCAHGRNVSIEEIIDWVPPEYVTKRINMQMPGVPRLVITTELVGRGPDQTDLVYRLARPRTAKDRAVLEAMMVPLRGVLTTGAAALIDLAAADAAERAAGREAEPDLPGGSARHLSAPVTAAQGPIAYLPET